MWQERLLCLVSFLWLVRLSAALLHIDHVRAALEGPIKVCTSGSKHHNRLPCKCTGTTADCNHSDLRTANIAFGVRKRPVNVVSMRNCSLPGLYKGKIVPGYETALKALDFGYNFIVYIQEEAFEDMSDLEQLDLSGNHLHHLNAEMFSGLDFSLISLKLDGNYLRNLTDSVFEKLTALKFLTINDNLIRRLSRKTFYGLDSLEELELDSTQLSTVPEDIFNPLPNLKTLSMKRGRFLIVPSLRGLENLRSLDLSENRISSVRTAAFRRLSGLAELRMASMPELISIDNCAFCGLKSLQKVLIYNCSVLSIIDPFAFGIETTKNLQVIDFEANYLRTLSRNLLPWENLTTLRLSKNPWNCDCGVVWMSSRRLRYQGEPPRCHTPRKMTGRAVNLLRETELCRIGLSLSRTGRIYVSISIILLIAAALTLAWYLCLPTTTNRRSIFYKPRLPRYGYRNLIMNCDNDDLIFDAAETRKKLSSAEMPEPVAL